MAFVWNEEFEKGIVAMRDDPPFGCKNRTNIRQLADESHKSRRQKNGARVEKKVREDCKACTFSLSAKRDLMDTNTNIIFHTEPQRTPPGFFKKRNGGSEF